MKIAKSKVNSWAPKLIQNHQKVIFCMIFIYVFNKLKHGKISDMNSQESRALSRGIWDWEGLDIAENAAIAVRFLKFINSFSRRIKD